MLVLRIEDTDAERNKPELVGGILDGLKWLGVEWDEGPVFQSQRTELYRAAAEKLLASGAAFPLLLQSHGVCGRGCGAGGRAGGRRRRRRCQGAQGSSVPLP